MLFQMSLLYGLVKISFGINPKNKFLRRCSLNQGSATFGLTFGWSRSLKPLASLEVIGWLRSFKPLALLEVIGWPRSLKPLASLEVIGWPRSLYMKLVNYAIWVTSQNDQWDRKKFEQKTSDFNFWNLLNELFHMIKNIKFSKVFSKSKK